MIYFLILSILINIGLIFAVWRLIFRLLQFDSLFSFLVDDMQQIIQALGKLTKNHLVSASPEVVAVHKTFVDAMKKLVYHVDTITSAKHLTQVVEKKPPVIPPSVID